MPSCGASTDGRTSSGTPVCGAIVGAGIVVDTTFDAVAVKVTLAARSNVQPAKTASPAFGSVVFVGTDNPPGHDNTGRGSGPGSTVSVTTALVPALTSCPPWSAIQT